MSIKAITWVLDDCPASGTELLVMIALADYADESGVSWPSIATLARRARCSERTAQRAVRALEADGSQIVRAIGGGRASTRYQITFNPVWESVSEDDETPDNLPPRQIDTPDEGDTSATTAGSHLSHDTAVTPEPSLNPQGTAAAAASALSGDLARLHDHLADAHLNARWDRLRPDQLDEIEQLIVAAGPVALVRSAQAAHQPANPAAHVAAWIPGWRAAAESALARSASREDCELHIGQLASSCGPCRSERVARTERSA